MELRTLQILCVDDDEADTYQVESALSKARNPGYRVHAVPSLHESYEAMESQYFDAVLLDLGLPGTVGLETLDDFRRFNANIPVVVLTDLDIEAVADESLDRGAQDYLIKHELSKASLTRAIRYAIQRQTSRTENKRLLGHVRANEALLHRKNQQLRKLYDTAHDFIDNVSHEFRTPLTVIKEYVSLMRDGTLGEVNDEQRRFLRIAEDRADDLNTMVDDMLDISKLEAGFLAVHRSPTSFQQIVAPILPALQRKADVQKIELSLDVTGDATSVFCDSQKIQRVLINLAVNAMKYTPPGGRVHIWTQNQESQLLVGVSDNGTGIASEHLESIFGRFQQANIDICSSTKGFGLGLSTANELVQLNLGVMGVKSDLGEGTTFTFTIPKNEPPEVAQRFLGLLNRDNIGFLTLLTCQFDDDYDQGSEEEVEGFLRQLIRGNYLHFRVAPGRWVILVPEPASEVEIFVDRAYRERELVNVNRPIGPLPRIRYTVDKSWVDHRSHQTEILMHLNRHFQDSRFPSAVLDSAVGSMAMQELNQ